MSLSKAVPECIKDRECKRITLRKHPLVPYVPKKDFVEEMLSALKNDQSLKTSTGEDAELRLSIWNCRMCKAFLTHMRTALDTIKKQGHFKAYAGAHELYVEQCNLAKQVKAALAELDKATSEGERTSKKSSKKHKEGAATADTPDPNLRAIYKQDLNKVKEVAKTAKAKEEFAAKEMSRFYGNLLSVDARYVWNKIIKE
jgi:hypothetical protein